MYLRLSYVAFLLVLSGPTRAQEQEAGLSGDALREALADRAEKFWVYDDLASATARSKATGKPLLISFRCVP